MLTKVATMDLTLMNLSATCMLANRLSKQARPGRPATQSKKWDLSDTVLRQALPKEYSAQQTGKWLPRSRNTCSKMVTPTITEETKSTAATWWRLSKTSSAKHISKSRVEE